MGNLAVSVIISLYNYEKYIGECLDSLLAQSFQDFEVIVVDDCSTDNSCAVVDSYAPKFNGRLKLTQTKINSGGGGEPRNRGLGFSRGEYVFFMDADDILISNGLEEMYTLAKKFNADTVYCEKYFMSTGDGQDFINNIQLAKVRIQQPPFVDEPTLETNNLEKRIEKALTWNYWVTAWLRLVSRDLLLENDIKFPSLIGSNDVGWTFKVLFCSKRFLRIPNPCYVRRMHEESVSFRKRTTSEHIHKLMDRTIRGSKDMDNFMGEMEFFRDNLGYRYAILNHFMREDFRYIFDKCASLSPVEVYATFLQKFGKHLGEQDVLVSCLCALVNSQQKALAESERINRENAAYISELENFIAKAKLLKD